MTITATQVKELREQTGAGIMDCKRALEEVNGDAARAAALLKQQGLAKAESKSGRAASQGVIEPYVHGGGRIGVIVEVNCETDFVARTPEFRELAHDLAMQVAATSPRYIASDEVAEADWGRLEEEFGSRQEAEAATILLEQPFIKDARLSVRDVIRNTIAKVGENIVVRRFARFEVGTADSPVAS